MILTSVNEYSEFCGQSDYDLKHVLQLLNPFRLKLYKLLAISRLHQLGSDAFFVALGFFWLGYENGRPLGRWLWVFASQPLVDGEGHA
jgi:hypothetical protein